MIKINKGYAISDIPGSLRLPVAANFESGRVVQQAKTTHHKREELLTAAAYIEDDRYNSRYKLDDVREALLDIYHSKCAFCEQHIEQYHVEHYRPKSIYYWLAFSWDNLILVCPKCNEYKSTNFPLHTANIASQNLTIDINIQSHLHDGSEQPYLVNPEVTDPMGMIKFDKDGSIYSDDIRLYYTIRVCKIDRPHLNDARKKLLDDFKTHLRAEKLINPDKTNLLRCIATMYRTFVRDFENKQNTFLAFRKYVIDNWLKEEIKAIVR